MGEGDLWVASDRPERVGGGLGGGEGGGDALGDGLEDAVGQTLFEIGQATAENLGDPCGEGLVRLRRESVENRKRIGDVEMERDVFKRSTLWVE